MRFILAILVVAFTIFAAFYQSLWWFLGSVLTIVLAYIPFLQWTWKRAYIGHVQDVMDYMDFLTDGSVDKFIKEHGMEAYKEEVPNLQEECKALYNAIVNSQSTLADLLTFLPGSLYPYEMKKFKKYQLGYKNKLLPVAEEIKALSEAL